MTRGRRTPFSYAELVNRHKGRTASLMAPDELRTLEDRTPYSQEWIKKKLHLAWKTRDRYQYPYDRLHLEARRAGLAFCGAYSDPPRWVDVWEYSKEPRTVRDKYGRVLFMDPGIKQKKRIRPEDFAPVTQFEPLYPMHPNPATATQEEKDLRLSAFMNAYAATGLITPSAAYVGVNYYQLLMWVNESAEWQARMVIADEAAKLIMVDIGRQRAMQGDSAMMRFFIERDNPDKYGRGQNKGRHSLPDGVTEESVVGALAMIQKAQEASARQEASLVDQRGEWKKAMELPAEENVFNTIIAPQGQG
jgi:hypothetical protein